MMRIRDSWAPMQLQAKHHHSMQISWLISAVLLLLLVYPAISLSREELNSFPELSDAGILLLNNQDIPPISIDKKKPFIPASTTKLITAWLALNHWGEEHHFRTDFYFDTQSNTLWIKGSGDPFLVSEELLIIAEKLKQSGLPEIKTIGLDVSLFQTALIVPGAGNSNNPYDAIPTAIAANFNTIAVRKIAGQIISAETQTPLTPIAKTIVSQHHISKKGLRTNTGSSSPVAEQYFAELLAALLRKQGITVGKEVVWGNVPQQTVYYSHINSKSLGDIIRPMMKYSTNFIANQLILMLSTEQYQRPANFVDAQAYMQDTLKNQFNWQDFTLKEGAGLSRDNRLSAEQLVELLNKFRAWKHLLPEVTAGVYAKSGTLNKVSTLAGYTIDKQHHWNAFALMMKQYVPSKRRNFIIRKLADR